MDLLGCVCGGEEGKQAAAVRPAGAATTAAAAQAP